MFRGWPARRSMCGSCQSPSRCRWPPASCSASSLRCTHAASTSSPRSKTDGRRGAAAPAAVGLSVDARGRRARAGHHAARRRRSPDPQFLEPAERRSRASSAGGVLKAEYQLPRSRYPADFAAWPDFREQHAFVAAILARAEATARRRRPRPSPAIIRSIRGSLTRSAIVGRENEAREPGWPEMTLRASRPDTFATVGVQLAARPAAERGADGRRSAPVVLINEAAARHFSASAIHSVRSFACTGWRGRSSASSPTNGSTASSEVRRSRPTCRSRRRPQSTAPEPCSCRTAGNPRGLGRGGPRHHPRARCGARRCSRSSRSIGRCCARSPNGGSRWCSSACSQRWRSPRGDRGATAC